LKIAVNRALDRISVEEKCYGAVFTSYSFDPVFFEDHVLRAVLRLTSDPVEQSERYHSEARRALQEVPVVAIVDAGERQPGRRLPFDLLEVSEVVFHPKSVLLLYREYARLLIGSGNLTYSGYSGNSELFLCVDLRYSDTHDAVLLTAYNEHLSRIRSLVRKSGTQLDLFVDTLLRNLQSTDADLNGANGLALIDSTAGPIIDQLLALLPEKASISSIGMLAPFYEKDDAGEIDETTVFGAFGSRLTEDASMDIGVSWENPQLQPTAPSELSEGLGQIWTRARNDDDGFVLEHFVPIQLAKNTVFFLDEGGQRRRLSSDEMLSAIEERNAWRQPAPLVFAPRETVAAAAEHFASVRLWLHPANRFADNRPTHRPLHAKLLVVTYRVGSSYGTLVLVGSPNMSRRALLMPAAGGRGNVEVALAFLLDGPFSLRDFVPELISAPASAFTLSERQFPEPDANYALAIEEATHDPHARNLVVTWSAEASALPSWRLTYDEKQLAASEVAPTGRIEIDDFTLKPSTAEIVLHVSGREYPSPILVTDLVALPVTFSGASVGLDELLLLLGRRIGTERAVQIANRRADESESSELGALFGEGFAPTDVFRAWWSVADDLRDPELSIPAFRLRLEGALGVGAAWSCMLTALELGQLSAEETWFYGAELLKALEEVTLPSSSDRDAKAMILSTFRRRVRSDLASADNFDSSNPAWIGLVRRFYEEQA
jgi:hypothetical protein